MHCARGMLWDMSSGSSSLLPHLNGTHDCSNHGATGSQRRRMRTRPSSDMAVSRDACGETCKVAIGTIQAWVDRIAGLDTATAFEHKRARWRVTHAGKATAPSLMDVADTMQRSKYIACDLKQLQHDVMTGVLLASMQRSTQKDVGTSRGSKSIEWWEAQRW